MLPRAQRSTLFPYTTLFRSVVMEDALAEGLAGEGAALEQARRLAQGGGDLRHVGRVVGAAFEGRRRSEEHTSELQSHSDLVCRLLLEKKKCQDAARRPAVIH